MLAAGVLGTVDLLLAARDNAWLPGVSGAVGKRVRTNSETIVAATARGKDVDFTEGVAITSSIYPDEITHIEPVRYPRGSDLIGLLAKPLTDGGPGASRPLRFLAACFARPGDFARSLLPFGWARRTILLLVMQVADNQLELVRRRRWYWPFGRALNSRESAIAGKRTQSYIPIANDMARRVAARIGGWPASSINEVLFDIPSTAHILGGACVGSDRETAVCDVHNQVFGHPGLYVVDASAIPVNLGVNPSLTITALAEHLSEMLPPLVTLGYLASVTSRIRLGTFVLNNDLRHPVLVARAAAAVDFLSGGRFELGMGAGHMKAEYVQVGIDFAEPSVRTDRLIEAVEIVSSLLEGKTVEFDGAHFHVHGSRVHPEPIQKPRPPILVGGYGL